MTRRESIRLLGGACAGTFTVCGEENAAPSLAPGDPMSPERTALIKAFQQKSEGLERRFESRTYKHSWEMPYRPVPANRVGEGVADPLSAR